MLSVILAPKIGNHVTKHNDNKLAVLKPRIAADREPGERFSGGDGSARSGPQSPHPSKDSASPLHIQKGRSSSGIPRCARVLSCHVYF